MELEGGGGGGSPLRRGLRDRRNEARGGGGGGGRGERDRDGDGNRGFVVEEVRAVRGGVVVLRQRGEDAERSVGGTEREGFVVVIVVVVAIRDLRRRRGFGGVVIVGENDIVFD